MRINSTQSSSNLFLTVDGVCDIFYIYICVSAPWTQTALIEVVHKHLQFVPFFSGLRYTTIGQVFQEVAVYGYSDDGQSKSRSTGERRVG